MAFSLTQWGKWYFLIPLPALIMAIVEMVAPGPPVPWWSSLPATGIIALAILSFSSLTIRDDGDALQVRFGPIPIFSRRIPYRDILSVEPAATRFVDGWGVHYNPRKGIIMNVWGYRCVRIVTKRRVYWIGTDDPEEVSQWVEYKIAAEQDASSG